MPKFLHGTTPDEKLLLNRRIDPITGCWRWTGHHIHSGYGQLRIAKKAWSPHRLAYTLWIGPIPSGMVVDHVYERGCRYRDCMNPAHLEAITQAENNRRIPRPVTTRKAS